MGGNNTLYLSSTIVIDPNSYHNFGTVIYTVMNDVMVGNSDWQNEPGTALYGGWNSGGRVWGSSTVGNTTFTVANEAWATQVTGNSHWMFNGAGGNDTISFYTWNGAAVSFNLAQIFSDNLLAGSNTFTVLGTGYNDTFYWNGLTPILLLDGKGGTDTLTLARSTASISLDLSSSQWSNIESFVGSDYNDTFSWNGAGVVTLDGGLGTNTLYANTSAGSASFNFAESTITNISTVGHNGTGNATYIFSTMPSFTIQGSSANDFVLFNTTTGLSININDSKFGSSIDSITGGSGNDTFYLGWRRIPDPERRRRQ